MKNLSVIFWLFILFACSGDPHGESEKIVTISVPLPTRIDSLKDSIVRTASVRNIPPAKDTVTIAEGGVLPAMVNTGSVTPGQVIQFAESLTGIPYVWASTDPKVGFDCSGFITYVFSHFNIRVPRSSIDFTHVGTTVPLNYARRGDIILFTGTNPLETVVGHMGLVVSNNADGLQFIHSTSGKAMGVTVSWLNEHYKKRFIRISRIFPQNG